MSEKCIDDCSKCPNEEECTFWSWAFGYLKEREE